MPTHRDIVGTVFWVGEPADADNGFIPNSDSAWDPAWRTHFGGEDDPTRRQRHGYWPADFRPKENPFYVALPYCEFVGCFRSTFKPNIKRVHWYDPRNPPLPGSSILKNRWVKVSMGSRITYVQWEDVGPVYADDAGYVFGNERPANPRSGIDLSPAAAVYLGLDGVGRVSWQFVPAQQVPSGPWKEIVTTRAATMSFSG